MLLETDRLVLREFVSGDWPELLAYQRDPRYLRYYPSTQRTESDVRRLVQMFLVQQAENPRGRFQLAITLGHCESVIGTCGIRRDEENDWEADIGFELNPDFWGRGYATEAARAMVEFGFRELNLHRVWSWCIADNVASAKVLEKVGLRPEGRLRENEYFKGRRWDTLLFGLLESEWRETRASA